MASDLTEQFRFLTQSIDDGNKKKKKEEGGVDKKEQTLPPVLGSLFFD